MVVVVVGVEGGSLGGERGRGEGGVGVKDD